MLKQFFFIILFITYTYALCQTKIGDYEYKNINQLTSEQDYVSHVKSGFGDAYNYFFNFCKEENSVNCKLSQTTVCQTSTTNNFVSSCGVLSTQKILPGTSNNLEDGLTFQYSGGTVSSACGGPRKTTIEVDCDKNADTPVITQNFQEVQPCQYLVKLKSSAACKTSSSSSSSQCPNMINGINYPLLPNLSVSNGKIFSAYDHSRNFVFNWNFCSNYGIVCDQKNSNVCQENSMSSFSAGLYNDQQILIGTSTNSNSGLTFVYGSGDRCSSTQSPRKTIIYVKCNPSLKQPIILEAPNEYATCHYQITMEAAEVCTESELNQ